MHFKVSTAVEPCACLRRALRGGRAGPGEPRVSFKSRTSSSGAPGGSEEGPVPGAGTGRVEQLLAFLCCFDVLLCSLQAIVSQSHARVCKGEEAAPPAVSVCDCDAAERFCSGPSPAPLSSVRPHRHRRRPRPAGELLLLLPFPVNLLSAQREPAEENQNQNLLFSL